MLVKTVHSKYPEELFSQTDLERGQWATLVADIDDIDLMAVKFIDFQPKMFISTCSTSQVSPPPPLGIQNIVGQFRDLKWHLSILHIVYALTFIIMSELDQ